MDPAPPVVPPADTADPTISVLKPKAKTQDRTPNIKATVTDETSEMAASGVRLYVDGKPVAFSYDDAATDELSATVRRLSHGWHEVEVVATDDIGNEATESRSFRVVRR